MALLHKVEHAVSMGFANPSCTSIPCRWNDCTFREVEPRRIKDLKIRTVLASMQTQKAGEKLIQISRKNLIPAECERTVTEKSKNIFLSEWKTINEKSVIFRAIEHEEESRHGEGLPLPLNQLADQIRS